MMIEVSPPAQADRRYRVVANTLDHQRQAQQSVFDDLTRQEVSQRFVAALANPRLLRRPDHPLHGQQSLAELQVYEKRQVTQPAANAVDDSQHDGDWVDVTAEFTEAAGVPEARVWAHALFGEVLARYRWWMLGAGVVVAAMLVRCASADAADPIAPATMDTRASAHFVSAQRIISSRWNHSDGSRLRPCELPNG